MGRCEGQNADPALDQHAEGGYKFAVEAHERVLLQCLHCSLQTR